MNERIKELAEQSGFPAKRSFSDLSDLYPRLDKFAELLVKECIDIVSPYAVRMENFDGGHPIADLKKHFGVE